MKKSTMIVLIVSASMILLGALMAVAAYAISGGNLGVYFNNSGWHQGFDAKEGGISVTKTIDTGTFTAIDIDVDFADVRLIPSNRYQVEYAFPSNQPKPVCTVMQNGTLQFRHSQSENIINFNIFNIPFSRKQNNFVNVYFPVDELEFITVNVDMGNVEIKDSTKIALKGDLNIECDFGKLTVGNLSAKIIDAEISSGESNFSDITAEKLMLESDFGKVTYKNVNTEHFESKSSSGDTTVQACRLGNAVFESDFGKITAERSSAEGLKIDSSSGDVNLSGAFTGVINISSDFGKVSLTTAPPREHYSLDLSTDFGKIQVDNDNFKGSVLQNSGAPNSISIDNSSGSITVKFQ